MKLNTLRKSLLISLFGSLISQPMGANTLLPTELHQPASPSAVVTTVTKPNRKHIATDEEFWEVMVPLNRGVSIPLNEPTLSLMRSALLAIGSFINSENRKFSQDECNQVLGELGCVAYMLDAISTSYLGDRVAFGEIVGPDSEKRHYKSSELARIVDYLKSLTKKIVKRLGSQQHNHPLKEKYCIKLCDTNFRGKSPGVLYILEDSAGLIPFFVPKSISNSLSDIFCHVGYGIFKEGVGSRGVIYSNGRLETRPGIF